MKFINKSFHKKENVELQQGSTWENIVEIMHDKYLDAFADEVIEVIYSKDSSMRYVVLKDEKNLFTYQLETIYQYDGEEWKYISSDDHALPAIWEPFEDTVENHIFESFEELLRELKSEPEYKKYFV